MQLSIIVPAHNEEKRIAKTLDNYGGFYSLKDTEIIIVLDGCNDGTKTIVQQKKIIYPFIDFIEIVEPVGKGRAVMRGFQKAQGDIAGFVDADEATSPQEFWRLKTVLVQQKVDGVIASRRMKESKIIFPQHWLRRLAGKCYNILVNFLFTLNYSDTQCGAKIFTNKVAKKLSQVVKEAGWAFDIDLLSNAKKFGYQIIEVPTVWADQDDSKLKISKAAPAMFFAVVKLKIQMLLNKDENSHI